MEYLENWYTNCRDRLIRPIGIPVVDREGVVKSIDVEKSWMDLYGSFTPIEMKRLEKKTESVVSELFYCMCSNRVFNISVLEDRLNEIYDRMLYMVCKGEENTLEYTKEWKEKWDENVYVGFFKGEKLFKYSLHVVSLYYKIGNEAILNIPFKGYEEWPKGE